MRLPLTVRWTTGAAVGETSTESRDVSSRGVYFFLSKDVKEGSPVEILLTLPTKLRWPDRYGSAASAACSGPSRAMKALLVWLLRSSATNSFAATKTNERIEKVSGRFPNQSRPIYELRQQRDLPSFATVAAVN